MKIDEEAIVLLKVTLKLGTLKMLVWENSISYASCCLSSACFEMENYCQGYADIFCPSEAGSKPPCPAAS